MATRHFFVTGGSGVLGLEILPRLLRDHPDARITVLLRPKGGDPVGRRLQAATSWIATAWPDADVRRLEAVAGDAGRPALGLDHRSVTRLRRSVTDVLHAAATTRLNDTPERAWRINVLGTLECLRFAESCPRLRRFAHVSTAHVCGDREGRIRETELRAGQRFLNVYEATKFEAELRVRARWSDLPVTILRPTIIVGDSRTGRIASFGSLYSPLRHLVTGTFRELPCAPDAMLDLVPVDYVAECAVRLLEEPRAVGGTYHLAAGPGRRTSVGRLLETAIRVAGVASGTDARIPDADFAPVHFRPARDAAAGARLGVFLDYLHLDREFGDSRARAHLSPGAPSRPDPAEFLVPLVDFCRRSRWGARRLPEVEPCPA